MNFIASSLLMTSVIVSLSRLASNDGMRPNGDALNRLAMAAPKLNAVVYKHALYTDGFVVAEMSTLTSDKHCK